MRQRHTKDEMAAILVGCKQVIEEEHGTTLRHLFYRLVGMGLINKTETAYTALSQKCMEWRRDCKLPWDAFLDATRSYYGVTTYGDMNDAVSRLCLSYRRDAWARQPYYLECWTEKQALVSILTSVCDSWGIPVFATKGYSSGTSNYNLSRTIKANQAAGKTVRIIYFGDWDPWGVDIPIKITNALKNDFNTVCEFKRVAINENQIREYDLPTRPTKTHKKEFEGDSVEIDSMPLHIIKKLCDDEIRACVDPKIWEAEIQQESYEREMLQHVSKYFKNL